MFRSFSITLLSLAIAVPLFLPTVVVAQETKASDGYVPCGRDVDAAGKLKNPCGFDDAITLANRLITGWIMAGVIIAAMGIAYAGYLYITAMGSEEKIQHAHSIFYKIVLGFVFMLSAWLIAVVLEDTFLCRPDSTGECSKQGKYLVVPSFLQRGR